MSFVVNFPLFSIVACLICSVASGLMKGPAARRLSLCLSGAICLTSLMILSYTASQGEAVSYLMGHFPHPWGNEIRMGILEPLFSAVFSAVMFLCLLGGKKHLVQDLEPGKYNLYFVMADLVQSALLVLVYTNDLFTGYVFIEICTLASCGLLMIRQIGRTTLASVRYMIFSLIGSGLFLFGVILLYNITGHLLMPELKETVGALWASGAYRTPLISAICLITVGIAIKSGMFPFHFWMPDTYGAATPCSSGILSGLVSKGYIFFLIKVIFNVFGKEVFYASGIHNLLYVFGALGILAGSLGAIREKDIFRMNAYSSAAQIGYIYMGIGISPEAGILAALFHIMTHSVTKPALFLASARLSDAAGGKKKFRDLQGTGLKNRLAGAVFAIGAFSMIGLPLTMGFISKFLFGTAAFRADIKLVPTLVVLALSTILNTIYYARTVIRLYNPPLRDDLILMVPRKQASYAVAAIVLAAMNLAAGIFARPIIALLEAGLTLM